MVLHHLIDLQIALHQLMFELQNTFLALINDLVQILQILVQPFHMSAGMGQTVLKLMISCLCMGSGLDNLLYSKYKIQ
ncbi:hypothetical protein D3C74_408200 [compost metagenome]